MRTTPFAPVCYLAGAIPWALDHHKHTSDRGYVTDRDGTVPGLPADYVDRPGLHAALDRAATARLTVVTAGSGWGKTTGVAAWASRRGAGWLSLADGDPSVLDLANGILRVARQRLPGLPARLTVAPSTGNLRRPPVTLVVNGLAELLGRRLTGDMVIVVDGLHDAPGGAAFQLVAGLCRQGPAGLHLVVLSRQVTAEDFPQPPGPAPIGRIGPAQLAFSLAEVGAFLSASLGHAAAAAARQIWSLTGGWPAAVRLAAGARRAAGSAAADDAHRPGTTGQALHADVLDTLVREALRDESECVRRLLTATAVLSAMDASLAEALGHRGALAVLPALEQRGLLRADEFGESTWSVLPPVRDVLLHDADPGSALARALHARAAAHREAQAQYGSALRHLCAARDRPGIERMVIEHGNALVARGDAAAVAAAADLIDVNRADARALTVLGYALQIHGDWLTARSYLRAAAGSGGVEPALALRLGQLDYLSGDTELAIEAFERARIGDAGDADAIRLLCEAAIWLRAAGEDDRARTTATRGAQAAESTADRSVIALAHRVLALLAAHDGDRSANDLHHHRALRLAVELGDDVQRLGLLINRASYLAEEGTPAEALETVEAALALGMAAGVLGYEPFCYSIRARAKARLGRFEDALADLDTAQQRWQEIGPSFDVPFGLLVRGDIHRRRGEPSQAQAALDEALRSSAGADGFRPLRAAVFSALARVRAAEDPAAARALAEQGVALATGTGRVPALLARGWVALLSGDREAAAEDAAQARAVAGSRRDHGGLAEALELATLSGPKPAANAGLLDEAVTIWHELGDEIGVARARLVAARLAGVPGRPAADRAAAALAAHGVRVNSGVADALAVPAPRPPILVRTLGTFEVIRDGTPIPAGEFKSRKARVLFKTLVAYGGRPVSRDLLMGLLWPDKPTRHAANSLSVLLSTLRTVLDHTRKLPDPGPIRADRDTIAIDPSVVVSDLHTFLAAAGTAQAADSKGDTDAPELLAAAEAAYTGEFLADDDDIEWLYGFRDEARTKHIAVLRALTRHATNAEQRVQLLLELLREDPYDEQSHLRLVHVLQRAGRHGEARRRYQEYAKRMAEIGVVPRHPTPPDPPPRPPGAADR